MPEVLRNHNGCGLDRVPYILCFVTADRALQSYMHTPRGHEKGSGWNAGRELIARTRLVDPSMASGSNRQLAQAHHHFVALLVTSFHRVLEPGARGCRKPIASKSSPTGVSRVRKIGGIVVEAVSRTYKGYRVII